jgi:hypothetical protein
METEREEEKEKEIEGRGRQERGRIDKMIDLQGQRHRKVPLNSDRSGSLQSSVYNRLTENEVAASHAVSRAG